KPSKIPTPQRK
nr:Chain C, 11MACF [Homo sapiens]7OLG_D Chain D, 11MACF [Homo sapiens]